MKPVTFQKLTRASIAQISTIEQHSHLHPWSPSLIESCFTPLHQVLGIFHNDILWGT